MDHLRNWDIQSDNGILEFMILGWHDQVRSNTALIQEADILELIDGLFLCLPLLVRHIKEQFDGYRVSHMKERWTRA
jgi:hypothetical protein